uniref:T-box domain-containing protein n=1 Tax=Tetraodon nigroviridis TaxID=99883 RepID=H3CAC2_TETNG
LSAESVCKGVRVTLDNNSMWNQFFRCQTEMILTKQGSRMFPYCRFRISGLQPSKKYFLLMDIQPLDNSRYKWTGRSWQAAGKAEPPVKSRLFPHPDSPSTGQRWMQSPVSFYKLKVTNSCTNPDGNVVLHPMHRYVPRLHVVQTDKAAKDIRLNGPGVLTFVFAQTEFMAVTSYQNSQFAQLKVDYNPFMKGLKDDGNSWGLKLKAGKDEGQAEEQHPSSTSRSSAPDVSTSDGMGGKALPGTPPERKSEADAAAKVEGNPRRSPSRCDSADVPELKQHLAKSKKAASRSDAPPPAVPSEAPSSAGVCAGPHSNGVTAEAPQDEDPVPGCDRAAGAVTKARPDEAVHVFAEEEPQSGRWPSSPLCPEAGANKSPKESRTCVLSSISPAERASPEAPVPEEAALLPGNSPLRSLPIGAPAGGSLQADLSSPGDEAAAPSNALQGDTKSSASAPDPDPPAMMPLLPDPECSSFCFESFSPGSSPEPLASLACSQAFEPKQGVVLCPSPSAREDQRQERTQQDAANKRYKYKKPRRHKVGRNGLDVKNCSYTSLQPNLEEVEEQLFVSFTSKEALQLHLGEDKPQQPTGSLVQQSSPAAENDTAVSVEQKISSFEKILRRDLKLMRHRQVIHPVLQEVGLKMNLLDPTLAIDLQYLGVRLPIPPPTAPLEPAVQELHPASAGACSSFVSRTGKTTDVTQIKGWREKFTPASAALPAVAAPEPQKKNLSAFCSDMLDEYLENEGRLIDERASTFAQPVVDLAPPLAYELPTKSSSYVRTLHSVIPKQTGSSTSELISGFVPPSKRPKPSLKETRNSRRETAKQRGPKPGRARPKPGSAGPGPVDPARSTWRTLFGTPLPGSSEDMAPLDSDSELGEPSVPSSTTHKEDAAAMETQQEGGAHGMTRALLRQKDLEEGVTWEGRHRTAVTEERAGIALTSLFTLMGFVRENPTAPIQLACRRAPPCLNDFCRLGCICSSLAYRARVSHCGRPGCMLGCSCLKQKVVLLK